MLRRSRRVLIFIYIHTIYRYVGGVQQSVHDEDCTFVYNIGLLFKGAPRVWAEICIYCAQNTDETAT